MQLFIGKVVIGFRKEVPMFGVAVLVLLGVLFFGLVAGADLFVAQFNSDELSNMGVERKS
jgi:hypothetical protein